MKNSAIILIILITPFLIVTQCRNTDKSNVTIKDTIHSTIFDSINQVNVKKLNFLNLGSIADSASWLMFTMHCSDTSSWGKNLAHLPNQQLGFMKLCLFSFDLSNDSLFLNYYFIYKDSFPVFEIKGSKRVTNGILFNSKSGVKLGLIIGAGIYKETFNPNSSYSYSPQPNALAFIKANKATIPKWFYNEALRRKIVSRD